jgi:hypothetical protein
MAVGKITARRQAECNIRIFRGSGFFTVVDFPVFGFQWFDVCCVGPEGGWLNRCVVVRTYGKSKGDAYEIGPEVEH